MIKLDFSAVKGLLQDFNISTADGNKMAAIIQTEIINNLYNKTLEAAKTQLRSTKSIYIKGMVVKADGIQLKGFLPNAIENGLSGGDLKQFFMNSAKVTRTKKGGWYLTIPLRLGSPNSQNIPNKLPVEIYKILKAKGKFKFGDQSANSRVQKFNVTKGRPAFSTISTQETFGNYENKTSVYEGAVKTQGVKNSSYTSFRRVSNNSSPEAWVTSGIRAYNLMENAWKDVNVEQIINEAMNNIL